MLRLQSLVEHALWEGASGCRNTALASNRHSPQLLSASWVVFGNRKGNRRKQTVVDACRNPLSGTSRVDVRRPDAPLGRKTK